MSTTKSNFGGKVLKHLRRLRYGLDTPREFILYCADMFGYVTGITHSRMPKRYIREHVHRLSNTFKTQEGYTIKEIRFPEMSPNDVSLLFGSVFEDTFYSYVYCNDKYDEKTFEHIDSLVSEGPYCLINDKVNVSIESGDIVFDVGSSTGDFAGYAAVKGAIAYAFEPSSQRVELLKKTAELNQGIIPVQMALGNKEEHHISVQGIDTSASELFEVTTIDNFVHEHNIDRVDFIKCDIEGNERYMLEGAQETLRRFAPKLALCTYHLPDDPEVMALLILKANPKYNIVQKRMKLFASVPD